MLSTPSIEHVNIWFDSAAPWLCCWLADIFEAAAKLYADPELSLDRASFSRLVHWRAVHGVRSSLKL